MESKTEDIGRNWGDFFGIDFPTAYAGVTVNTFRLDVYDVSTSKLMGVKYTLARKPADAAQREIFRGASGISVYENADVFPRAWAVHEAVSIPNSDQGRGFIHDRVNELRREALWMGSAAPQLPACPGAKDSVAVKKYAAASITIEVDMTCDGMVVISDTDYPGWYARVDDQPASIYEVDLAFRGVPVPKGAHVLTFHYRPRSVFWGAGLTMAGLLGAAALTVWSGKKRHFSHGRV